MSQKLLKFIVTMLAAACTAGGAWADLPCPEMSSVSATFATGRDRITISPDGGLETFAGNGITIDVYVRNCAGLPIPGIPAVAIGLFNSGLCICPGGNSADAPTDADGHTTFTGTMNAGGCVESLDVVVDGVYLGTVPVKTNGPDHLPASPCFVDASDLASFARRLGFLDRYSICYDYNETGPPTIDASDLAYFAALLGAYCPP